MNGKYGVCPECQGSMTVVTEFNNRTLYKCHNFDCGIMVMIDDSTGKELQRWDRNDVGRIERNRRSGG